ncbi:hypothetical protein BJ508DRAFT_50472 [Ascobolus immersus RN42]|uniref:Uncharacterized protein n=1 Tax=Ascobolus immersus RN42 TaxID=1160509 RepID=A0A3N4IGD8_ASCIM|nr:hypothetical protein BJ508DRAFT_50472 [Ascobolus immersus RN42]
MSLHVVAGRSRTSIVFVDRVLFGLAHDHRLYWYEESQHFGHYPSNQSGRATSFSAFEVSYTTIFGSFAAYTFMKSWAEMSRKGGEKLATDHHLLCRTCYWSMVVLLGVDGAGTEGFGDIYELNSFKVSHLALRFVCSCEARCLYIRTVLHKCTKQFSAVGPSPRFFASSGYRYLFGFAGLKYLKCLSQQI